MIPTICRALLVLSAGVNLLAAAEAVVKGDSSINAISPDINGGALGNLQVGAGSQSLIHFDLATVPPGTQAEQVVSAKLVVWVNRMVTAGSIDVAPINDPWDENSVTHANRPTTAAVENTIEVTAGTAYVTIDVTAAVKVWVSNPAINYGVMLSPSSGPSLAELYLDSKENTASSHAPRLLIALAGVPGTPGAIGPRGVPGTNGTNGISGYQRIVFDVTILPAFIQIVSRSCPAGKRVVSGGFDFESAGFLATHYLNVTMIRSFAVSDTAWELMVGNQNEFPLAGHIVLVCAAAN